MNMYSSTILHMMGAACEMPNPSPKWQDLAIQKLNHHGNLILGETRKKFGISTQEPGRITRFPNTLLTGKISSSTSTLPYSTYSSLLQYYPSLQYSAVLLVLRDLSTLYLLISCLSYAVHSCIRRNNLTPQYSSKNIN